MTKSTEKVKSSEVDTGTHTACPCGTPGYINVDAIVQRYLRESGHDGLMNYDGQCGCLRDNLISCGEIQSNCIAAYNHGTIEKFVMRECKPIKKTEELDCYE